MDELKISYTRLVQWTDALRNSLEGRLEHIENALKSSTSLPKNCPSHASLALMEFNQVLKKYREVEGAIEDVLKQIRNAGA